MESAMVDQLLYSITHVYELLKVLVGGVAGLYLIMIAIRWVEMRRMKKVMRHVEAHLRRQSHELTELRHLVAELKKRNTKDVRRKSR